jgi:hypothetical protein
MRERWVGCIGYESGKGLLAAGGVRHLTVIAWLHRRNKGDGWGCDEIENDNGR